MRVLVTGAGGFVGRALAARLAAEGRAGPDGPPLSALLLTDLRLPAAGDEAPPVTRPPVTRPPVTRIEGSLTDPALRARLLAEPVDLLFHLAAVPGGEAERREALGWAVNRDATQALLEALAAQGRRARVVYAGTVGVFGVPMPARIDDDTQPLPTMSYGAQKLMTEVLLADLTRRGRLDARAPRLPGIVPRPREGDGLVSAFLSAVFHAAACGGPLTLPVSPAATVWLMSRSRAVGNLLHAARLAPGALPARRAWTLPALRLGVAELLGALAAELGAAAVAGIRFAPDAGVEAQFGRAPPLHAPLAEALGFRHDGDAAGLVRQVLADLRADPSA